MQKIPLARTLAVSALVFNAVHAKANNLIETGDINRVDANFVKLAAFSASDRVNLKQAALADSLSSVRDFAQEFNTLEAYNLRIAYRSAVKESVEEKTQVSVPFMVDVRWDKKFFITEKNHSIENGTLVFGGTLVMLADADGRLLDFKIEEFKDSQIPEGWMRAAAGLTGQNLTTLTEITERGLLERLEASESSQPGALLQQVR